MEERCAMPYFDKRELISKAEALPGRTAARPLPAEHFVNGRPLRENWGEPLRVVDFGMGCFWGAERLFWQIPGVYVTAAGYAGGFTPNPTYEEVCSGRTGHTETVRVVYDSRYTELQALLQHFWEEHDPTQYMHQGNDIGSNYRSAIYVGSRQDYDIAAESRIFYAERLRAQGRSGNGAEQEAHKTAERGVYAPIVTELALHKDFYYAEACHQQYLAKNPDGYCGLKGTGISCPLA